MWTMQSSFRLKCLAQESQTGAFDTETISMQRLWQSVHISGQSAQTYGHQWPSAGANKLSKTTHQPMMWPFLSMLLWMLIIHCFLLVDDCFVKHVCLFQIRILFIVWRMYIEIWYSSNFIDIYNNIVALNIFSSGMYIFCESMKILQLFFMLNLRCWEKGVSEI